jgi:uncharacterized protein YcgI (DUF1989 family)
MAPALFAGRSPAWKPRQNKDDGGFTIRVPETKPEDHLDLRAEMNIIAAISACPSTGPVNNYSTKPLGVKVFEML